MTAHPTQHDKPVTPYPHNFTNDSNLSDAFNGANVKPSPPLMSRARMVYH